MNDIIAAMVVITCIGTIAVFIAAIVDSIWLNGDDFLNTFKTSCKYSFIAFCILIIINVLIYSFITIASFI